MDNRQKVLNSIDQEFEIYVQDLELLARRKRELTKDLDLQMNNIMKRMDELKSERQRTFLELYPTLYVIRGKAEARRNAYLIYVDYEQILACFTTEAVAKEVLGNKNKESGSHHDFKYSIKVEATVNIPKNILENLNKPPQRWLGWSP